MAGTGIWLSDQDLGQTAGAIWAQQQITSLGAQMRAGQDWANEMIARAQQQAQAQMQSATQTAPVPVSATPVPAPTPVAPVAALVPAQAPEPVPVSTVPTPTPAPAAPSGPTPFQAGQDWAQEQIQNLLNPGGAQSQPAASPLRIPGLPSTQTPPGAPTTAPAPQPTPTPSPTPSTPGAPAGPQSSTPGDLIDQTRQAAIAAGIDPDIFSRQIQQESGFNPNAVSPAGARGIAQFMPGTAQGLGINPDDPSQALPAAANLMKSYLDKYGGDWSKALAAYNAGPGNVDQYGGVPPFQETQTYVKNILGGAQNLVQQGLSAVNTAVDAVHSAVARVSQFAMGLSSGDAMAFCGPAAALAFAQTFGRNPTVAEAKDLATKLGWNPDQGMAGPQSEVKLLNALGVDAHMTSGVDWGQVGRDASGGNPVIIDTPGHYYYIDGYDSTTGKFHVGTSGTDLKGGSEWMSADQINAMPQSQGSARAAIFADHPLAQQNGSAQTQAQSQPLTMGTMQPASSSAPSPMDQLLSQSQNLVSGIADKAQQTLQAVQDVGSTALGNIQTNRLGIGNPLEAAFGTPEQPSGLSQQLLGGGPSGLLNQGLGSARDLIANAPVLGGTLGMLRGPELRSDQEILDAASPQDLEFARMTASLGQPAGYEPSQSELADQLRNLGEAQSIAQTHAPVGPPTAGEWARGLYRGGVISGLNTMADVATNSVTPAFSVISGTARDLASFQPGRLQGRMIGAQSGLTAWANNFLASLSQSQANPNSLIARAGPGLARIPAYMAEGAGALHGAFQNSQAQLVQLQELGSMAGEYASSQTGRPWMTAFQDFMNNPPADALARAEAMGQRTALRGDLGRFASGLAASASRLGPFGDALFPVYRMGISMASRLAEWSPIGLAGTAADVARATTPLGRVLGEGPYAGTAFRDILGAQPAGSAVGPVGERLSNGLLGTALAMWLASKALDGSVTGEGPQNPDQRKVLQDSGVQFNSFRSPIDGQYYSWEKLPVPIRSAFMAAGAYGDAAHEYDLAQKNREASGTQAYGVPDPKVAAAERLVTEVAGQLASMTPLRTFANLYDMVQGGSASAGQAALADATNLASNIAGGAIPLSGALRSVAQMTDPNQRFVPTPRMPEEVLPGILQRIQENLPIARETLPAKVDVLGRPMVNPLEGLAGISPVRPAGGQSSPILTAMQQAGVAPSAAPPSIQFGNLGAITLTPAERQTYETYRGQLLEQIAGPVVNSPEFAQMPDYAQRATLQRLDQAAGQAASRMMLRDLAPTGMQRVQVGGVLAPVQSYGPMDATAQAQTQRRAQEHQALIQALLGS